MEIQSRAEYLTHWLQRMEASLKMSSFAKCPHGSHNYCIKEDVSCYDFITHIFSRWPEVNERLLPLALVLFGFDPGSKIHRESRRTWEEDWKAARQLYLPCRGTTSFPPEIPSSSIWLPTWNSDTLKPWNPEIFKILKSCPPERNSSWGCTRWRWLWWVLARLEKQWFQIFSPTPRKTLEVIYRLLFLFYVNFFVFEMDVGIKLSCRGISTNRRSSHSWIWIARCRKWSCNIRWHSCKMSILLKRRKVL